ncbi:hypothetical protein C4568_03210 [Candidatus Parcubacteria bacterium]|nr:MAG: hypothetical protein C4568_03210 [Candidatus Parcubacteria bacterium]
MTQYILKLLGFSRGEAPTETDDFSEFFLHAKSKTKAKVMREIMREATEEQEALLRRYQDSKLSTVK